MKDFEEKRKSEPEIIVVHETLIHSVVKYVVGVLCVVFMIGIGAWLESAAMQWFGFLLAWLVIFSAAIAFAKRNRMTVQEAEDRIRKIKAETQ